MYLSTQTRTEKLFGIFVVKFLLVRCRVRFFQNVLKCLFTKRTGKDLSSTTKAGRCFKHSFNHKKESKVNLEIIAVTSV